MNKLNQRGKVFYGAYNRKQIALKSSSYPPVRLMIFILYHSFRQIAILNEIFFEKIKKGEIFLEKYVNKLDI